MLASSVVSRAPATTNGLKNLMIINFRFIIYDKFKPFIPDWTKWFANQQIYKPWVYKKKRYQTVY